ncbi:hypothetical protein C8R46DRAFT_514627 [Mycena filopes]|nr:hypothetical protein C8R46DRAFT_514627 [Mycena filopes]
MLLLTILEVARISAGHRTCRQNRLYLDSDSLGRTPTTTIQTTTGQSRPGMFAIFTIGEPGGGTNQLRCLEIVTNRLYLGRRSCHSQASNHWAIDALL